MKAAQRKISQTLAKAPTGVVGLDQITLGGIPKSRVTLVCGGPGSGKTLLGMEILLRGAVHYEENGVILSFEETAPELSANVGSLGYDLSALERSRKILVDHVQVERRQIEEAGDFELDGLFVRLQHAIETVNAKRVLLDSLEVLFGGFTNHGVIRAELRRLFHWLKDQGVTAIVTAETGKGTLTRHNLEEYVADCVIMLDHRVTEQVSTRRLRVVKYRGTAHGTNEYPFLMDEFGISVVPITSVGLAHTASKERVSAGISGLDEMLEGKGFFRGSSVLITGTAGTGKTSLGCAFAEAACRRGERCLYFAFEESPSQIIRNLTSIGIGLKRHVDSGALEIHSSRPTSVGMETHLAKIYRAVHDFQPTVVLIDPITNLVTGGEAGAVKAMLMRLIDMLKSKMITGVFTSLTPEAMNDENAVGISSLMDTWIALLDINGSVARHRQLKVLKSRGMAHASDSRVLTFDKKGISLNIPKV